ncbi:MAG: hypothetical protein ACMXYF_00635 [Candidatus Woesearchaeota archaeon]
MNKQGFIAISFHWLFIALIGGFLLFFFFNLVSTGVDVAQNQQSIQLVTNLETLFSAFAQNEHTDGPISIGERTQLTLSCDFIGEGVASNFRANRGIDLSLNNLVIYSPVELEGPTIYAKTIPANMPFYVGSVLLLVDTRTKFYFEGFSEDEFAYLVDALPRGALVENWTDSINDRGMNTIVVVSKNGFSGDLPSRRGLTVRNITLVPGSSIDQEGTIRYGDADSHKYIGEAMLLGALVSDENTFLCNTFKLMQTFSRVSQVMSLRAGEVQLEQYTSSEACRTTQSQIGLAISRVRSEMSPLTVSKYRDNYATIMGELQNEFPSIRALNRELVERSCPVVY